MFLFNSRIKDKVKIGLIYKIFFSDFQKIAKINTIY
jgi:hypothetical protein